MPERSAEFVLEAHLEDFLRGNWKSIRWSLARTLAGPNGESGHQLRTPVGRLDFLRVDRASGSVVVVELKRGRPSDKVAGQLARYMGFHIAAPGQCVQGLIIGHEVDDSLRYAISATPTISLMTSQVIFNVSAVESPQARS